MHITGSNSFQFALFATTAIPAQGSVGCLEEAGGGGTACDPRTVKVKAEVRWSEDFPQEITNKNDILSLT